MSRRKRNNGKSVEQPETPWIRRHGWKVLGGSGLGAAIAVLLALFLTTGSLPFFPGASQPPDLDFGTTGGKPLVFEPVWNPCTQDWRPTYGLDCDLQQRVFGSLPPIPKDLSDIAQQVFFNEFSLERLMAQYPDTQGSQYWLQPEFWPSWNETRLQQVLWPPVPQWTVFGFKFYTVGKGITLGRDTLDLGTAVMQAPLRAAWGEDLWQGFHIYPVYPSVAVKQDGMPMLDRMEGGNPITQDPNAVPFRVTIETLSDPLYLDMLRRGEISEERREGGQFIVLPPNYLGFPTDWIRMISLRITFTTNNPPPGIWFFALHTANPSAEVDSEYSFQYGLFYESAGDWPVTSIAPLFQGFVVV